MSLKAKIEAVIYASEEPVTLAQLVGLLGQEAQAELDALAAAQQRLELEVGDELRVTVASEAELSLDPGPGPGVASETGAELAAESVVGQEGSVGEVVAGGDGPAGEAVRVEVEGGGGSLEVAAGDETAAKVGEAKAAEVTAAKVEKERARRLREYFRELLEELVRDYAAEGRGLEVREVAGGFRLATKPEYHDAVRGFVKSLKPPLKLSLQALETLAVVAYKQPVTAPEVSEIRGVDSGGVLGSLMARKLVTTAGRKQVIGRPILYKTTKDFLLRFGLRDIGELPSIEEFEKMAGELAEQEEIPMEEKTLQDITDANLEEEREAVAPQADGDSSELGTVPVDGRISGLPPVYDEAEDPSAREAEIQREEKEAEG